MYVRPRVKCIKKAKVADKCILLDGLMCNILRYFEEIHNPVCRVGIAVQYNQKTLDIIQYTLLCEGPKPAVSRL